MNTKILIIVPSLTMGGMERVASNLANHFAKKDIIEVHLLTLNNVKPAYPLVDSVILHQSFFKTSQLNFTIALVKSFIFLRKKLKVIKPDSILSFGDRYNSFVILANMGLKSPIFISSRQNPTISNGKIIDLFNSFLYPYCDGIIVQTKYAREIFTQKYKIDNIISIPNPFILPGTNHDDRSNQIINVGRFADEKNQTLLIKYFNDLNTSDWNLLIYGDGHKKNPILEEIQLSNKKSSITLMGNVNNIDEVYRRSSIFAFTSTSEGFPNALGEAMAHGCACISFNCIAGPSDLIEDNVDGFLIPVGNHDEYKKKLQLLINDKALREKFSKNAFEKMKKFSLIEISTYYFKFITTQ